MEWIRTATSGALKIDDGALYTPLHRETVERGWSDVTAGEERDAASAIGFGIASIS